MSRVGSLSVIILLASVPALPVGAQSLGPSTGGLVSLDQSLRFLGHTRRVLMIGAHPDDEDTELLTVLARGMGAEAAYLALTRGEGGQNLIGTELGPALGVLRTEELLAARSLDGARQYFTRAYDFGFSKSLADTWRFWPKDSVLKDVVRVIRRFQPQVVVAIFSGTPRDGHGQHQASGWAAREAFHAAADPARFPELVAEGLAPWQARKLYQGARFDPDTATGLAVLEGGAIDRAVGQSYLQIAMRGRSLHRSQDMGVAQRMGPSMVRIRLIEGPTGAGADLFAGVDTSLGAALGPGADSVQRAGAARVSEMLRQVTTWSPGALAGARSAFRDLLGPENTWTVAGRDQMARFDAAAAMASGVVCDATTGKESVVPGGRLPVAISCWNTGSTPVPVAFRVAATGPGQEAHPPRQIAPGRVVTDSLVIEVPGDAEPTRPYYLRRPLQGAMYDWRPEDAAYWTEPAAPTPFAVLFDLGGGLTVQRDVVYRTVDQALGEVRRPVFIVPRLEVRLAPGSALWPSQWSGQHDLTATVHSNATDTVTGTLSLQVPAGWQAPASQPFRLSGRAEDVTIRFRLRPAPGAEHSRYVLRAVARDESGHDYSEAAQRVEYPHIRPRQLMVAATSEVVPVDIRLPTGPVAYLRGAADAIPEALAALGLHVTMINPDSLGSMNLAPFHTLVIGPRAWETGPALAEHNERLLDWVRAGGTMLVQYQQFQYLRGGYAPWVLSLAEQPGGQVPQRAGAPRVAEEDAAVTVLVATHPAFRSPNPIGAADWTGWVQERGLYFPRSWGPEWTPLLEMSDAGEPPQRGALLVARAGRGTYIYTGLSFFRELPAAVPGAARLFLNLLALGRPGG